MALTPVQAASAGKLAVIGGRLEESNVAVFAEMHRLAGGRILLFPTASSEPKAVGAESLQVFRSHGFDAEIAPLTACLLYTSPSPRDS